VTIKVHVRSRYEVAVATTAGVCSCADDGLNRDGAETVAFMTSTSDAAQRLCRVVFVFRNVKVMDWFT
jgi:hypothetical protein